MNSFHIMLFYWYLQKTELGVFNSQDFGIILAKKYYLFGKCRLYYLKNWILLRRDFFFAK